jgi:simple sugar transport system ATP-binding protein
MRDGVVPDFTVAENLILADSAKRAFANHGVLRSGAIRAHTRELVAAFDIRTPTIDTPTRNLSGGNIQKLIMARELSGDPAALLVAQPTRGIDIAAAHYVHDRLREHRARGIAILIISEDLDEVISLSDRVLVMYEGRIIGEAGPETSTREAIGLMMAGVAAPEPPVRAPAVR